jgi:hypothetical protein
MINRITAFLEERKIPKTKKELILNLLKKTLQNENINKSEESEAGKKGESQLKRVFTKIVDDL